MKYVYKYENMKRIDYVYVLRFLRYLSFFKTYVSTYILLYTTGVKYVNGTKAAIFPTSISTTSRLYNIIL